MKTVFFDVDTQIDFVYPAGALYAPGAESIVDTIAKLNRRAVANGSPLISTTDAHSENDPEFRDWPPHCVVGAVGQLKPAVTLIDKRLSIPSTAVEQIPLAPQILLEKQHVDCFTNQNLVRILEMLEADRYVVYGVVTEVCVKFAAVGLLRTGKPVAIVTDAIRPLKVEDGRATLDEFVAMGGMLTTSAAVL